MGSRSSNPTSQNISTTDRRQALDGSIGVSGDGSSVSYSSTTNNSQDFSNRSTNSYDLSNRSTNNISTTTNNTVTDLGAIAAGQKISLSAIESALTFNKTATDFSSKTVTDALAAIGEANHISENIGKKAIDSANDAAKTAMSNVASAWQNAKVAESGKTLGDFKYIVFGLIGVFALLAYKRG